MKDLLLEARFFFFCGFMGSGKSTLVKRLAGLDMDECLFAAMKIEGEVSLKQVIERVGWQAFRKKEYSWLQQLLENKGKFLVALGGGAITQQDSLDMIKNKKGILIFLETPFEVCWQRISRDYSNHRPLVEGGKEHLEKIYNQRRYFYQQAHFSFSPDQFEKITSFDDLISLLKVAPESSSSAT